MIEFINAHPVAIYAITAITFAVVELKLSNEGRNSPDEAFWLTVFIAVIFPFALIRRAYIVISHTIFWMLTPSKRKVQNEVAAEVTSILNKIKKATSKSA